MKRLVVLSALALLLVGAAAQAQTIVENFNARLLVSTTMPGTNLADGNIRFQGVVQVVELSFTVGSVPYDGQWIEFAGHEREFMSSSYNGFADFVPPSKLSKLDPSTTATCVDCTSEPTMSGVSSATGAVEGSIDFSGSEIQPGSTFSTTSLDVGPVGVVMNNNATVSTWSSTSVSELNGATVTCAADEILVSVDAASGIAELTLSGNVLASGSTTGGGTCCPKPKDPTLAATEMSTASFGFGLLLAGLGGQGLLLARRRRRA